MSNISKIASGFDLLSNIYDPLLNLFLGRAIHRAQTCFLDDIKSAKTILIVGGGTGKLLVEVLRMYPDAQISYVDLSQKMMDRSYELVSEKLRNDLIRTDFLNHSILDFKSDVKHDVIITPFILDCFNNIDLDLNVKHLKSRLAPNGKWLHADFNISNQSALMKFSSITLTKSLYIFFNLICKLEVNQLPDFKNCFEKNGLSIKKEKEFVGGMIKSLIIS
ncbi:MAG: class I SAM-dependent methyltransferase [Flavobacteriales bacterium]|nr:class I SAM-dependent methyltransferase [Flavobacteriales bacterium]